MPEYFVEVLNEKLRSTRCAVINAPSVHDAEHEIPLEKGEAAYNVTNRSAVSSCAGRKGLKYET